MKLAPLDYYFARPNLFSIQFAFRFGYPLDAARLKRSLAEVAEVFTPVRSRLVESGKDLAFEAGAVPILESVDHQRPHLDLRTSLGEPLARVGLSNEHGRSVLSFSISHGVGDGFSYFLFLAALARAYRRKDFSVPSLDRSVLDSDASLSAFTEATLADRISYFLGETPSEVERPGSSETFDLEHMHASQGSESDLQMAILLRRYPGASRFGDEYLLRFPVDFRRLLPEVPKDYFGNAVRDALVRLPKPPGQYPIAELTSLIRSAKKAVTADNVRDALACYSQLRRRLGIAAFQRLQYPGLLVSNLTRIPLETLDFGNGCPLVVNGPGTPRLALLQALGAGNTRVTYYFPNKKGGS